MRLDRAILGINVRFIEGGRICLQTLAMKELFKRHTAKNFKREVFGVLSECGVALDQVYSVTADSGANILLQKKTGRASKMWWLHWLR